MAVTPSHAEASAFNALRSSASKYNRFSDRIRHLSLKTLNIAPCTASLLPRPAALSKARRHAPERACRQAASKQLARLVAPDIVAKAAVGLAMGAIHLTMQLNMLHVTDDMAVHVQLMQVTAAVIQMIDLAAIRQGQLVDSVAGTRLFGVAVELGNQPTNLVTLEQGMAFGSLTSFIVANLIQVGEMPDDVVAETVSQIVDPHLFTQTIRGIVGKAAGVIVLVDQRCQANSFLVLLENPLIR